jgi:hypothetical protein
MALIHAGLFAQNAAPDWVYDRDAVYPAAFYITA